MREIAYCKSQKKKGESVMTRIKLEKNYIIKIMVWKRIHVKKKKNLKNGNLRTI